MSVSSITGNISSAGFYLKSTDASSIYYSFAGLNFDIAVHISTSLFWIYEEVSVASLKITNLSCQIGMGFVKDVQSN